MGLDMQGQVYRVILLAMCIGFDIGQVYGAIRKAKCI